jgi:hypothetical protein
LEKSSQSPPPAAKLLYSQASAEKLGGMAIFNRTIGTLALLACLLTSGCCHDGGCRTESATVSAPPAVAESYVKTELYFGLSKPTGAVTEAEWKSFLDEHVTPAFPDGLTVLDASGQWKNSAGTIVKENTKLLILIHKPGADADSKLDALIAAYKKPFQQESVLRVTTAAAVSF